MLEYEHFINSFTIEENVFPFPNHIDPQGSIRVLPALPSFAEDLDARLVLWLLFVSWSEIYPHVEQDILLTVIEIGLILSQLRLHVGMSQKTEWALHQGLASMETGVTVQPGGKRQSLLFFISTMIASDRSVVGQVSSLTSAGTISCLDTKIG